MVLANDAVLLARAAEGVTSGDGGVLSPFLVASYRVSCLVMAQCSLQHTEIIFKAVKLVTLVHLLYRQRATAPIVESMGKLHSFAVDDINDKIAKSARRKA